MNKEKVIIKRTRLARPKTLVFFGIIFLLLPILNYFGAVAQTGIKYTFPLLVLKQLPFLAKILLLLPIPVGIGLLLVKKWGWWLFQIYAVILILHNIYVMIAQPDLYNLGAIFQTILGCAAVFYFAKKDISAPYVKMYPRGWRGEYRKPLEIDIEIDGKKMKTRDFSVTGFYVDWPNAPYNPQDSITISLQGKSKKLTLSAGVVRIDPMGIGVAFRGLSNDNKIYLEKLLK